MLDIEGCGDPCGWVAAAIAALSYGSYGVPIKATIDIDVHPLVLQTYKTIVLFFMSWIVLLLGEEVKWTGYGIFAGFLNVSGGSFGILGIRNAGMAVAVGTWASVMVLSNFFWGILIFREPVNSFPRTCIAFGALIVGLIGMSKFGTGSKMTETTISAGSSSTTTRTDVVQILGSSTSSNTLSGGGSRSSRRQVDSEQEMVSFVSSDHHHYDNDDDGIESSLPECDEVDHEKIKPEQIIVFGIPMTKRDFGVGCAVMNGILGGSSLIPMHFAKAHGYFGLSFVLSMGSGSLLANTIIWVIYFLYIHKSQGKTIGSSFALMPNFYLRELWFRGMIAGLLLAIALLCSIVAISILGQGVGNSMVQTKILISGLWGIFWFKEVKDTKAITKWFASATLCVASILWLSYERNSAVKQPSS